MNCYHANASRLNRHGSASALVCAQAGNAVWIALVALIPGGIRT
jgi:hypothetical protein